MPRQASPSAAEAGAGAITVPAQPPAWATNARTVRSVDTASPPSTTTVCPAGSASAIGVTAPPATTRVSWSTRGSARPIRSASTSGSPSWWASGSGSTPFSPAASNGMTAAGSTPVQRTRARTAAGSSSPEGSFSPSTRVPPSIPTGTTGASPSSAGECSRIGPAASTDRSTWAYTRASPPPPEPSSSTPVTRASTSPAVTSTPGMLPGQTRSVAPAPRGTAASSGTNSTSRPKQAGPNTARASGVRIMSGVEIPTTTTRWP